MKVAEGRSLGDPETIHFGLIPRSHRGIVAINELPDLAERIQVAMLNVMEERDIQIRGYVLRLPLDVLVVASANPEDYTNRGRIITPLKDRFGAEIRTHYPVALDDEVAVIRQESHLVAEVPDLLLEILARFARALRASSAVDQRSGVSARLSHRRRPRPWPPPRCTGPPPRASRRPWRVRSTWRRSSTCSAARSSSRPVRRAASATCSSTCCARPPPRPSASACAASTWRLLVDAIDGGGRWSPPASRSSARDFLAGLPVLGESDLYDQVMDRLDAHTDGERARRHRAGPRGPVPRPPDRQGRRWTARRSTGERHGCDH